MIYKILYRIYRTIMRSLQLQLFLTLMSSPILIYWGLPISMMSPLGNMIFHPLLTLFLLMSSVVFFCHVLCIPSGICIKGLKCVSHAFHYCLSFGSTTWLIGFSLPYKVILILIPVFTCCILVHPKTRSLYRSTFCLFILSCMVGYGLKFLQTTPEPIHSISCNNGILTLVNTYNKLFIIDPGVLGKKSSTAAWVEYNLVPWIIKSTGQTNVDGIIVQKPNKATFKAVNALCLSLSVGTVYLPKTDLKNEIPIKGTSFCTVNNTEMIMCGNNFIKMTCHNYKKRDILNVIVNINGKNNLFSQK